MKKNKKLLEMRSVTVAYNGHPVLRDLDLDVYEQDFLGIVGANGSGKTTLIKVLLNLIKPIKGTVRHFFTTGASAGQQIGYLPQQNMFDKKFPISVHDVVLSGLASKAGVFKSFTREDKTAAHKVLERMGIPDLKKRAIGTLSGGQMQRVFLARALVSSPALLVLDEPDTFIDKSFTEDFYEILKELNQHMAIILVSHDLGMISSYVKAIACLNTDGNIFCHGCNHITQEFLDSYNCPIDLITHGDIPHRVLGRH